MPTTYRRRVEFAETDAAGIVHFSVFFRYMEEAEHAVWRKAGLNILTSSPAGDATSSGAEGAGLSWPRIAAKFDFKAPLKFQDEFEIVTQIGAVSRSTIQWAHVVMRGDTTIGSGSVTAVCVRKLPGGGMKSAEIPADILEKLRGAGS